MGSEQSVQKHFDFTDLATNYQYESKYSDTRFGEVKLLKSKNTGDRVFQKDFTSNAPNEFNAYIEKIKTRLPLVHPNILKVLGYNSKKEDLFCADFFKISLFFESFETDLEKEIHKRSLTKHYFTETELRCLLDSVVAAGAFLQKHKISHGDIRPFNIFITKNKEYKICDNTLFHSFYNPSYFNLMDGLEAQAHYPSPQVFRSYQAKKDKAPEFNPYKNDVYGLGASLLMAAKLDKINDAYDYKNKVIKQQVIDCHLEDLKEHYSQDFITSVRVLLHPDEEHRPDFLQLDEEIRGYRGDVRAKANLERSLEAQRIMDYQKKQQQETPVKSGTKGTGVNHLYYDDEIDKIVRKAVIKSEEKVNKSPSKYKNDVLDNCIDTYLKKEPFEQDKPLLYTIAPYLTMENRFVPTLKVYSNDRSSLDGTLDASNSGPNSRYNPYGSRNNVLPNYDDSYNGEHQFQRSY